MKTKAQLIAQCKAENPTMVQILNGEEIILDGTEYETVCESWANMQLAQQLIQADLETKTTARQAILDRLGITAEEAQLIIGGSN